MTHSIQEERGKTHSRGGESSDSNEIETKDRAINPFKNVHDYLHFRATNSFFRFRAPIPFQRRSVLMSSFDLSRSPLFILFEKENL